MTPSSSRVRPGKFGRRWLLPILLLAVAQAAVLELTVNQVKNVRPSPPFTQQITLAADESSARQISQMPWLDSPTLFAVPSLNGFSGGAWLQYQPPSTPESPVNDVPLWLEMQTNQIGRSLMEFSAQTQPPPLSVVERRIPWRDNLTIESPRQFHSELQVQGPLAHRRLLSPASLPDWAHPDVLAESHVQVVVDSSGQVLSAVLVEAEGRTLPAGGLPPNRLPEADRFALDFAQSARFEKLPTAAPTTVLGEEQPLEWGRLVFQWQTIPAALTNKTSSL